MTDTLRVGRKPSSFYSTFFEDAQPSSYPTDSKQTRMRSNMATFDNPETRVKLRWGKPSDDWDTDVRDLYISLKANDFSKYFYQSDVQAIRLLCSQHTRALEDPDMTAAGWKMIWEQWDKFGVSMKSRASVRYTQAKTTVAEDYSADVAGILSDAFGAEVDS